LSDLTIALAALGGLVLAAMAAHGAWQARNFGGQRRRSNAAGRGALHEMREPVLDIPPTEEEPAASPAETQPAPVEAPAQVLEPRPAKRAQPRLDALIDAMAALALEAPVSGDMVLTHLPHTRRAGSKPFLVEGLNLASGEWEAPAPGQRYGELQAGVQLANRTGPLNEIEYSEFVQKVQAFAEAVGAMADFPDMLDVVARARELDAFAGDHDAQLAVHLHARSAAWSLGYVQQHAAQHGFVAGSVPGRLVLPGADEGSPPMLALAFDPQAAFDDDPSRAALRDVTLSFDVPQTDPAAEPFGAWQASAQALALAMDADIVDDHGRPLSAEGFAAIASELEHLYAKLAARDLAAGSPAARRLFS
jgi:hypothetical protein